MNDYYNPSGAISPYTLADARTISSELSGIQAGFDKMPKLATIASSFGTINFRAKISEALDGSTAVQTNEYFSSIDADGVSTHPNEFRIYKRTSIAPFYEDQGDNALPTAFSHTTSYPVGTVGAKLKQVRSVTDRPYSALGDGIADDRAAFVAADTTGGFVIPAGSYKIASNLTIASSVFFAPGASLVIPTGVTVTFSNYFEAPPEKVFYTSGTGKVVFSKKPEKPHGEWWGAVINNGGVDSGAALQACLTATGGLFFPKGLYYGSTGLVDSTGCVIRGEGKLFSGYSCSSATAHLLDNSGTTSAFATGGDYEGFALIRSVTPTTPALAANDATQGHGIHLDLVSNPRIKNVYTYNNLVEVYHKRCLSPEIDGVRGLRQTGGGSDRWVGYWVDGNPAGMPGGWAGGPSGNPSARIGKLNMVAAAAVGTEGSANLSRNYVLQNHLQDLWIEHAEAGGGHTQFDINPNGNRCSDAYIANAIADGFLNKGFHVQNLPIGNNFAIRNAWMAPSAAAATASSPYGLRAEMAHGLTFRATGDFTNAPAIDGVYSTDANNQDIRVRLTNCQVLVSTISVSTSTIDAEGICTLSAADAGYLVSSVGGGRNEIIAGGTTTGTKQWIDGVALDSSASGNVINVTKVADAAISGAKFTVAGAAVPLLNGAIVYQSGAATALTGSVAETVLATLTLPAGWLGANGSIDGDLVWSMTNNANTKTLRARLGGIGGFAFWSQAVTTSATARGIGRVQNANAVNAQKAYSGPSFGFTANALLTGAIDTSVAQTIVITGQLANAGDSLTLESATVRVNPGV